MHEKMITISFPDGRTEKHRPGVSLYELIDEIAHPDINLILAAKVNRKVQHLSFQLQQDSLIEFLYIDSEAGIRIYKNSLGFLLAKAVSEIYPECQITIEHTLGKAIYGEFNCHHPMTVKVMDSIEKKMHDIVRHNIPVECLLIPREEAIGIFLQAGRSETVQLLRSLTEEMVHVIKCDNQYDYCYEPVVHSTGCLKYFRLRLYLPGFILQYPEMNDHGVIPKYTEHRKLSVIFRESAQWAKILEVNRVGALNDSIESGEISDIIRVSEALQEKKIAKIADQITGNRSNRLILIAGPSSSGKTTFAQRLMIQLRVNGLKPIAISIDNYFVNRDQTPVDENGNYDFETIEAIDLELFNDHLIRMIQGDEVELPVFNFNMGCREYNEKKVRITEDQPIIIEGIHGLNEKLTHSIPKHHKFKIYISALTQINIDDHNRIPTTDARLIRRIVRDNQFRGRNARVTLGQWTSVRRGEEKYIFPYQEEADAMFNSAQVYELPVLKNYAEPLLSQITENDPEYADAVRLLRLLSHFPTLEPDQVPGNSILREFIGNGCFIL